MRSFIMALSAAAVVLPATMAVPTSQAEARRHYYQGKTYHKYCRKSSGTTGLVAGGVGGALVGNALLGHGLLGAAAGAAGGAFAGRAIDRSITAKNRCHYY